MGAIVLSTLLALVFAGSAQAANIVPNPGFESDCAGVPCMWGPIGFPVASVTRDTSNPHTDSASMQVASMGGGTGAASACIAGTLSGTYGREFWYRTTDMNVITLQLDLDFYTSTNCTTGASAAGFVTVFPAFGTTWQHVVGTNAVAPMGAKSYKVVLAVNCGPCPAVANVDDIVMEGLPTTAVTLASFTASRSVRGAVLRWRTASEAELVGFNLYGERAGRWARLNRGLIPATGRGRAGGAAHSFLDRGVLRSATMRYRLQTVGLRGSSRWFGPVKIAGG